MTLTINLPPHIEAGLLAQAQAQGLDMPHYVESILIRQAMAHAPAEVFRLAEELTFEERRKNLQKLLESVTGNTVVLPHEAMGREAIYEERGL